MPLECVRPDVTDLVLRVYQKPLHPEVMTPLVRDTFRWNDLTLEAALTHTGHVLQWRQHGALLAEAIMERTLPFGSSRSCLEQKIRGCRTHTLTPTARWQYSISSQLEILQPDVFLNLHEELLGDLHRSAISQVYPTKNRLSPSPLSILQIEPGPRSFSVQGYHTFPSHHGIVRTQSLLELES